MLALVICKDFKTLTSEDTNYGKNDHTCKYTVYQHTAEIKSVDFS